MKLSQNIIGINGVAPSATNPLPVRLTDGATFFSAANPLPVALPTDASTATLQAAGNASLSSIDGKLPALNSGRIPVDIGGDGSITITSGTVTVSNEVEIKNDANSPVPISGTVTANIGTIDGIATETTLSALNTKVTTTANGLKVDGSAVTQPVSGTVTANAGTGSFTVAQATAASLNAQVVGNVAAGASDAGNPVKIGGVAKTTQPTAVTDGQRANILTDKLGRVIVAPGHVRDLITSQATAITGTAETTVLTAVAATFLDVSTLVITNAANQATVVSVRDATAGTVRAVFNLAANGGIAINMPIPWKQTAVNNNWTVQQTGAGTINVFAIAAQNI